jgi:hypothetical protein
MLLRLNCTPFVIFIGGAFKCCYSDKEWLVSLIVDVEESEIGCKYTPKSDLSFIVHDIDIPLLILEIISGHYDIPRDRSEDFIRMILQTACLVRFTNALLGDRQHIVMAVYFGADLLVSRYLVYQRQDGQGVSFGHETN